jgi:hypothetical protein
MKRQLVALGAALLLIAALVPPVAATNTPVAVYHGTWQTAGWAGDPVTCPADFFPASVPASGNWNVTILPGGKLAVVHITMFSLGMHIDSWGGKALGDFWTVDSATSNGFHLTLDLTATPYGSTNTFAFDGTTLTFTIAPWVAGPFSCTSAIATGNAR